MTTLGPTARLIAMHRLLLAGLFTVAIAVGGGAFSSPIAHAEWDIEAFDKCMAQPHNEDPLATWHMYCCINSGGTVTPDGGCTNSPEALQGSGTETGTQRAPMPAPAIPPAQQGSPDSAGPAAPILPGSSWG
jgi:hypothetical protein